MMAFVQGNSFFLWIFVVLLGLSLGSFVNAVVYRLPKQLMAVWRSEYRSIFSGECSEEETSLCPKEFSLLARSSCPRCHHLIYWWQNIPLFSYVFLKGSCFFCREKISFRYPLIEMAGVFLTAVSFYSFGWSLRFAASVVFGFYLLAAALIDFDTHFLPDELTWPLLMLGFALNSHATFVSLSDAVWGAIVGYYFLWIIYWVFFWLTRRHGFGFGDFKLLCSIGAWVGWRILPLIIFGACVLGLLVSIVCFFSFFRSGGGSQQKFAFLQWKIPFGPYLACVGWLALFLIHKPGFQDHGIHFMLGY